MLQLCGDFLIGKIHDKFYAFYIQQNYGGVTFSAASPAFHTIEEAHEFLINRAKDDSTETEQFTFIEVVKHYALIGNTSEDNQE